MANERGASAQWREPDGAAVAPAAVLGFLVETETPGVYEVSRTGPADKVWVETETAGVYEAADGVAEARTVIVGDVAIIL